MEDDESLALASAASASTTPTASNSKQKRGRSEPPVTGKKPKLGLASLLGFNKQRGDFDVEYDHDAELLIADMSFNAELDTPWERALKLQVLDIYNHRLDARIERKKFVIERGILGMSISRSTASLNILSHSFAFSFWTDRKDRKRSKEESQVFNALRPFARFHSVEEHEALVQGLVAEQHLRRRIAQLQQWRMNGCRTLKEAEIYERDKQRRESSTTGKRPPSSSNGVSMIFDHQPPPSSSTESTDFPPLSAFSHLTEQSPPNAFQVEGHQLHTMDAFSLLQFQEKLLCLSLRLTPSQYFIMKERLLRECLVRGYLNNLTGRQLLRIGSYHESFIHPTHLFSLADAHRSDRVFDFFVSNSWISTNPQAPVSTDDLRSLLELDRSISKPPTASASLSTSSAQP